jgi:hypothetical protein
MKSTLLILGLLFTFFVKGQEKNDTIRVIAQLISPGIGSKIYIADYKVIKLVKGFLTNDTIEVGYYFYKEYKNAPDTALLNLTTYTGPSKTKDYYIFPEYDAKKGIEKVKISKVDLDYWKECEKGKGDCKPLTLTRSSSNNKWFLFMPCNVRTTNVTLSKHSGIPQQNEIIQKNETIHSECPPIFDLTNLSDGKYFVYILAGKSGRQIEINLKTDNE